MKNILFVLIQLSLFFSACTFGDDGSVLGLAKQDKREQKGLPFAITDFRISDKTYNSITLNWIDNSEIESGYKVEISSDGENFQELATLEKDTEQYSVTNLSEISHYFFRVKTCNENGESDSSIIDTYTGIGNELVFHYKFEDNFLDEVSDQQVTPIRAESFIESVTDFGKAICFDRSDEQYLKLSESSKINVSKFTISCHVYISSSFNGATAGIIDRASRNHNGFEICIINYDLRFYYYDGTQDFEDLTVGVVRDKWFHIALTVDNESKTIKYYYNFDGETVKEINLKKQFVLNPDWPIYIGGRRNKDYLNGAIDDFRFYDGILSDEAILQIKNGNL